MATAVPGRVRTAGNSEIGRENLVPACSDPAARDVDLECAPLRCLGVALDNWRQAGSGVKKWVSRLRSANAAQATTAKEGNTKGPAGWLDVKQRVVGLWHSSQTLSTSPLLSLVLFFSACFIQAHGLFVKRIDLAKQNRPPRAWCQCPPLCWTIDSYWNHRAAAGRVGFGTTIRSTLHSQSMQAADMA
jgi:hypothetical protein